MSEMELVCANCGRHLDIADKFCRDCGLPTVRQAQRQKQVAVMPPDTNELHRALNAAAPDPKPFVRGGTTPPPPPGPDTTGDVLRATNPTATTKMATATTLMLVMIAVFAILAVVFLVLALRL